MLRGLVAVMLVACGHEGAAAPQETRSADVTDVPVAGATPEMQALFDEGDALFNLPLRAPDGLGPVFIRQSCAACHAGAGRGPASVQRMAVTDGTDEAARLPFGTVVRPLVAGGGQTPVTPPADLTGIQLSTRLGISTLGRGFIEAILDSEIERGAAAQAAGVDGVHGRVNHVVYASEANPNATFAPFKKGDVVIGRFGLKARISTLEDFTADALQGDMGITSPLRPTEVVNPDGQLDDDKPGVDTTAERVTARANYMRLLAIPRRTYEPARGGALFEETGCATCHVPSMRTRADYPFAPLAGIDAKIYSDLLLHDMGEALADGLSGHDGEAGPRDWKTAPLIGLRFAKTYLHDGRATTLEDAVRMHDGDGSEARGSVGRFKALGEADRRALMDFVGAL